MRRDGRRFVTTSSAMHMCSKTQWTGHVWHEEIALASVTNAGCACDPMLRVGRASGFCT